MQAGIALEGHAQIRVRRLDQAGVGGIGLFAQLAHAHGAQLLVAELSGELIGQGAGDVAVRQDHRMQHGGQAGSVVAT